MCTLTLRCRLPQILEQAFDTLLAVQRPVLSLCPQQPLADSQHALVVIQLTRVPTFERDLKCGRRRLHNSQSLAASLHDRLVADDGLVRQVAPNPSVKPTQELDLPL